MFIGTSNSQFISLQAYVFLFIIEIFFMFKNTLKKSIFIFC